MNTHLHKNKKSIATLLCLLLFPFVSLAQENTATTSSYFSNPLFNTLLVTIILLAILVMALSNVLKNISGSDFLIKLLSENKDKEKKSATNTSTVILLFLLFAGLSAFGQENASAVSDDSRIGGLDQFTFYFMVTVIFVELIVTFVLIHTLKYLLKSKELGTKAQLDKPKEKTLLNVLSGAVDIDKEETIMLDHDYDGIKELDNDLPPWWKYGFYLTILVSVVYLIITT